MVMKKEWTKLLRLRQPTYGMTGRSSVSKRIHIKNHAVKPGQWMSSVFVTERRIWMCGRHVWVVLHVPRGGKKHGALQ